MKSEDEGASCKGGDWGEKWRDTSWSWPALRVVGRSGCSKPIPRFVLECYVIFL